MREAKRVLFAPKLWGLLALLLAISLFLTVTKDTHAKGFYAAYRDALPSFSAVSVEEAQAKAETELAKLQAVSLLHLWQTEENGELRTYLREDCVAAFGEDFEAQISDGTFDLSDAAMQRNYLRREVLQTLLSQLAHLQEYPAFLAQVQENVKQMSALAMFSQPDSFSQRNIEKTGRDFPLTVDTQLDNDFAITMLATDELGGYLLLLFTLFLTLQFLEERKRGLWCLVYGTARGRMRLASMRAAILLLGVTLGVLLLFGGKLLFGAAYYGGLGDLTRSVQSIAVFADFPWVMPVWVYLLGYFLLKILGMWLVGMAVWAVLQAVHHLPLALAAAGVLLAGEYALFRWIPDSYAIVALRYVNLFALADVPRVALHYLNLNVFGWPVQGFLLSRGLIAPLLVLLFAVNLLLAARKKPVSRQNSLLSLFERLRVPISKAVGRRSLFGMELYQLLWLQKGILVLLAVFCVSFFCMEAPLPDTGLYDTELAGLSASMQGPITEETLARIDGKIAEYAAWEPSEAVVRQLDILERLREKTAASVEAEDGLWLINQAPFAALMGRNIGSYQRQNAVLLLLALTMLLSGTFAQTRQSGMTQLLSGTPRGRGTLWRKKCAAAMLLTVLVWLIFELGELRLVCSTYTEPALAAPLQSFDAFAALPYQISLGTGVAVYLLLRLFSMCAATGVILLISRLCRHTNTALLLGCAILVLPACLSLMGITVAGLPFFGKLLSPLEANAAAYVYVCAPIGVFTLFASRCREKH